MNLKNTLQEYIEQQHLQYIPNVGHHPQNSFSQQEYHRKLKDKLDVLHKQIEDSQKSPDFFKNHSLPLARVKKIMKSDEEVRMISAEAPALFAKACEIFIIELTYRSWFYTEESRRRTLQRSDIASCINNSELYDFLMDIIPREERNRESNQL